MQTRRASKLIDRFPLISLPQAVSNFFVAIRKRRPPNHLKHSSIGTQSQHIAALAADEAKAKTQRLTTEDIAGFVLTTAQQKTWEYIFEVPEGEGGAQPHEEGCETECGRCGSTFVVPKGGLEGLGEGDQTRCFYHWGRRVSLNSAPWVF